jgi:hypothetical protein
MMLDDAGIVRKSCAGNGKTEMGNIFGKSLSFSMSIEYSCYLKRCFSKESEPET